MVCRQRASPSAYSGVGGPKTRGARRGGLLIAPQQVRGYREFVAELHDAQIGPRELAEPVRIAICEPRLSGVHGGFWISLRVLVGCRTGSKTNPLTRR
jgi:hypothetical protein